MENQDLAILVLLVAAVFNLTVLILFVRLCGRVKQVLEAYILVNDLEKATVWSGSGTSTKTVLQKKGQ